MGKIRYEYVQKKVSESGQTGEATYDLPEAGFIPEILLTAYCTPTAVTNPALPLSEALKKVEIIDGSTVIKSYSGNQLKGLAMIHGERAMCSPEVNDNAVEGRDNFLIKLGGVLNGVNYAPDFSKFSNPQLKVQWDHSQTVGCRGSVHDADTSPVEAHTIMCAVNEGGEGYTHGYVRSKEVYTFTQAVSTLKQVEIPRGDPLVGIGVEAGYSALDITDDLNKVKLDFNTGEYTPLELEAAEVISSQMLWFGEPFVYEYTTDMIDNKAHDVHMGWCANVRGNALAAGGRSIAWEGGRKGVSTFDFTDVATPTAIAAYEQIAVRSRGYAPFGMWYCPMSALLGGQGDTMDTAKYRRIIMELTSSASASTSSTPSVIAEYLITK